MKYLLICLLLLSIIIIFSRNIEGYYGPLKNIDYPYNDLAYYGNMDAVSCMGLCDSFPDCIGLSSMGQNCWIKNTNAFNSQNKRTIQGLDTYLK